MNLADAILPSATPELAVLDIAGVVVWVNDSWIRFARENDAPPGWTGVGESYLAACVTAGDPPSLAMARAIRAATRGELAGWAAVEVPCHSPTERRWFDVVICPRLDDRGRSVGASVTIARLSLRDDPPPTEHAAPAAPAAPEAPVANAAGGEATGLDDYPDPLLAVDHQGRVVAANEALCQLFGRTAAQLIGGSVEQLVPVVSMGMHRRLRAGYLQSARRRPMGRPAQAMSGRHADGRTFPVRVSLSPAQLAGRSVVLAAVRDASEQVAADTQARLVADLLDVTADAIVVHAAEDLRPVWANRTMAELTGWSVQELLTDAAAAPVLGLPLIRDAAQRLLDGSAPEVYFSSTLVSREGRSVPVAVQLVYRERSPGEGYLVAVRRDVTEQERMLAERERRATLAAAASEVRLAVLSGRPPADCLDLVCRRAADLAGVRWAAIWMPGHLADRITLAAASGGPPMPSAAGTSSSAGRTWSLPGSVLEPAFRQGRVIGFEERQDVGDPWGLGPDATLAASDLGAGMAVPLAADGRVLGVLTLVRDGDSGPDRDEIDRMAEFGVQVGVALEYGQLRRDHDREAAIVAASAEILLAVLSSRPMAECLELICDRATGLLDADVAMVLTPAPDSGRLLAVAMAGPGELTVTESLSDAAWQTIRTGEPAIGTVPKGTAGRPQAVEELAAPLQAGMSMLGALVVLRAADQGFSPRQVDTLTTFASYAATTLEVGRLRADRERLARLEERERIARDLHDSVIQDLFASGLRLSSALKNVHDVVARQRVQEAVATMDGAIGQLRATIFRISEPGELLSARALLDSAAASRAPHLGYRPQLEVTGNPELLPSEVVTELIQILSEALSNTARHSGSTAARITLNVGLHGRWDLEIHDNGTGFDPDAVPAGHGLANIATRAALLGATLSIESVPGTGTGILLHSSPLPPGRIGAD
jgi:PAS domain S-box-containing protein